MVSVAALWQILESVPDPEIPVVSVVELGIVRGLEWDEADPDVLVVRVTPTYSGCPATELIAADIRALAEPWRQRVDAVLAEATLAVPASGHMQRGGKQGVHTEQLGYVLAEMQFLQRAYPGAQW